MRFRGALIALGILAALGAYLYFVELPRRKKADENEGKKAFAFSRDDAVRLTVERKGEPPVEIERMEIPAGEEGKSLWKWRIVKPLETYADGVRVDDVLRDMESLVKKRELSSKDLAAFGLDAPDLRLAVELRGGAHLTLDIGADTPIEPSAYAKSGDGGVFLIDKMSKTTLGKSLFDLRDRRAVAFEGARVRRIEIKRPSESLILEKHDTEWRIKSPVETPAEQERVDNFFSALESLVASTVVSEKATDAELKKYDLGKPMLRAALMEQRGGAERRVDVLLSKKDGELYAARDWDGALLKISEPRWDDLDATLDTMRRRGLVTLKKWEIKAIEIKNPSGKYVLAKENWEWKMKSPEEKAPDRVKADDLAAAVSGLHARAFINSKDTAAYGLDKPFLELKVEGEGRKEAVTFGRGGAKGKIFAAVEGWDGTILDLDEADVDLLLKPRAYLFEATPSLALSEEDIHE